jgi:predicted RNase H-like nuclease (RuvC/YqgF family)
MSVTQETNTVPVEKYRSLERKLMKKTEENNKLKTLIKDYEKNIDIMENSLNSAKEQFLVIVKSLSNQKRCELCVKNEDLLKKNQNLLDELECLNEKLNRCQIEKNCLLENSIGTYVVNCIRKRCEDKVIENENETGKRARTGESSTTVNSFLGNTNKNLTSELNNNSNTNSKVYEHDVGYVLCEPIPSLVKFMYSNKEKEKTNQDKNLLILK